MEAILTLAVTTGMRRGELLGLHWQDIDFERGSLQVRRTMNRISGHGLRETEPKTAQSRRNIVLPQFVVEVLKEHRARQREECLQAGDAWKDHDLVFSTRRGGFLDPTYLLERFQKLLDEASLPHMRFHELRHSAATMLLSMGINAKVVQELLGHSTISMTLGTYSHVLPGMQRDAMDGLDDFFRE